MNEIKPNWVGIRIMAIKGSGKSNEEFICNSCEVPCVKIKPLGYEPTTCINSRKRQKNEQTLSVENVALQH
jgi:hypothetical protein